MSFVKNLGEKRVYILKQQYIVSYKYLHLIFLQEKRQSLFSSVVTVCLCDILQLYVIYVNPIQEVTLELHYCNIQAVFGLCCDQLETFVRKNAVD